MFESIKKLFTGKDDVEVYAEASQRTVEMRGKLEGLVRFIDYKMKYKKDIFSSYQIQEIKKIKGRIMQMMPHAEKMEELFFEDLEKNIDEITSLAKKVNHTLKWAVQRTREIFND